MTMDDMRPETPELVMEEIDLDLSKDAGAIADSLEQSLSWISSLYPEKIDIKQPTEDTRHEE